MLTREKRRAPAPRKGKKKSDSLFSTWWPLLLGIAVTPLAIHAASIMALEGPNALMILFPWVLLLTTPALGLANEFGSNLSQILMYIQFPVYGLLMALVLRSRSFWIALSTAAAAHFAAVLAVSLMIRAHIR